MDKAKTVSGSTFRIRLTEELKEWLFDKANKENRTVTEIIRSCLLAEMNK